MKEQSIGEVRESHLSFCLPEQRGCRYKALEKPVNGFHLNLRKKRSNPKGFMARLYKALRPLPGRSSFHSAHLYHSPHIFIPPYTTVRCFW
jgi:hypothetical protein